MFDPPGENNNSEVQVEIRELIERELKNREEWDRIFAEMYRTGHPIYVGNFEPFSPKEAEDRIFKAMVEKRRKK